MKIIHEGMVFVHIPKTGGKYLTFHDHPGTPLETDGLVNDPETPSGTRRRKGDTIKIGKTRIPSWWHQVQNKKYACPSGNQLKFRKITEPFISIIRNPFDWLLSYYNHGSTGDSGWNNCNKIYNIKSFEEFIQVFCDPNHNWHVPVMNKGMCAMVCDDAGAITAKYLIYYEQIPLFLKEEYDLDVDDFELLEYQSYYTDGMIDLVSKKFARELELFNYSFEGKERIERKEYYFQPVPDKSYFKM